MTKNFILKMDIARSPLWLLAFFILACKNQQVFPNNSIYTFEKEDSIDVILPYHYNTSSSTAIEIHEFSGVPYLYISDLDNRKILKINLEEKLVVDEVFIPLLITDKYPVFCFHVINEDEILILRDISNFRSVSDSAFFIINKEGKRTKQIDLEKTGLLMHGNAAVPTSLKLLHKFRPLYSHGNRIFFNPATYYGTITETEIEQAQLPILVAFDSIWNENYNYSISPFKNPYPKEGLFSSPQKIITLEPLNKNEVLVSYGNSSVFYKVNFASGNFISSDFDSTLQLISSPSAVKNSDKVSTNYNQKSSYFGTVLADPKSGHLLRFGYFGRNDSLSRGDYNEFLKNEWFGVYDSNLQFLGQGIKPKWFSSQFPKPAFYDNSWVSIGKNQTDKMNLRIYFSNVVYVSSNLDSVRNVLANIQNVSPSQNLKDYPTLKKLPSNAVVLLVPESSCPSCVDYVISYYMENLDRMIALQVYLLTNSQQAINLLGNKESTFIIKADRRELENYLNTSLNNPMIFKWRNNEVAKSIILNPQDLSNLEKYINLLSVSE